VAAPSPCSATSRRDAYERRRPDETLLYQLIEEHWPTFLERAEQSGGLPDFVVKEFEAYLRCGILEHGLAHFACRRCGESTVVSHSCKKRGFCPSCTGRRMADVAADLVDEVFPEVPVRQWVCSLPWRLRYAMGYDRKLCADVLDAFITSLRRSLRRRAKAKLELRSVEDALFGAVTFIQRADSSLRLNVHFHCLVLDGVYVRDGEGELRFHSLGAPTSEEVTEVARWTHERLGRVLERHGRSLDVLACDDAPDLLAQEQPALASCYGASVADRQLLGDAPGQQTRKLVHPVREVAKPNEALAEVGGVNVHAGAAVPSRDRQRRSRLCRYVARPPLSQDRLETTADGRYRYNFRHAWNNGVHAVLLAPLDLIARLCALIPPPRFHMLRYHGVLAAHAKVRPEVVPGPVAVATEPAQIPLSFDGEATELEVLTKQPARHPWAWLLQRVFAVDIMTCPRCRGAMRLLEIANKPDDIARVLAELGLGPRPPPRPRPAPPGQLELDFAA
jgi:hypothetical protein